LHAQAAKDQDQLELGTRYELSRRRQVGAKPWRSLSAYVVSRRARSSSSVLLNASWVTDGPRIPAESYQPESRGNCQRGLEDSCTRAGTSVQTRVCVAALRASLIGKYLGERETRTAHSLSAGRKLASTIGSLYRTSRDSERRDRDDLKESETKMPNVNDLWRRITARRSSDSVKIEQHGAKAREITPRSEIDTR